MSDSNNTAKEEYVNPHEWNRYTHWIELREAAGSTLSEKDLKQFVDLSPTLKSKAIKTIGNGIKTHVTFTYFGELDPVLNFQHIIERCQEYFEQNPFDIGMLRAGVIEKFGDKHIAIRLHETDNEAMKKYVVNFQSQFVNTFPGMNRLPWKPHITLYECDTKENCDFIFKALEESHLLGTFETEEFDYEKKLYFISKHCITKQKIEENMFDFGKSNPRRKRLVKKSRVVKK